MTISTPLYETATQMRNFFTRKLGERSFRVEILEVEDLRPRFDFFKFIPAGELGVPEERREETNAMLMEFATTDGNFFRRYLVDLFVETIWKKVRAARRRVDERVIRHLVKYAFFVRAEDRFGVVYHTQKQVAAAVGMSADAIAHNYRVLESLGILATTRGDERRTTNGLYKWYLRRLNHDEYSELRDDHQEIVARLAAVEDYDVLFFPVVDFNSLFADIEALPKPEDRNYEQRGLAYVLTEYLKSNIGKIKDLRLQKEAKQNLYAEERQKRRQHRKTHISVKSVLLRNAKLCERPYAFDAVEIKPNADQLFASQRKKLRAEYEIPEAQNVELLADEIIDDIYILDEFMKSVQFNYWQKNIGDAEDSQDLSRDTRRGFRRRKFRDYMNFHDDDRRKFESFVTEVFASELAVAKVYNDLGYKIRSENGEDEGLDASRDYIKPMLDRQRMGLLTHIVDSKNSGAAIHNINEAREYRHFIEDEINANTSAAWLNFNILPEINALIARIPGIDPRYVNSFGIRLMPVVRKLVENSGDRYGEYLRLADVFGGANKSPMRILASFREYLYDVVLGVKLPPELEYLSRGDEDLLGGASIDEEQRQEVRKENLKLRKARREFFATHPRVLEFRQEIQS